MSSLRRHRAVDDHHRTAARTGLDPRLDAVEAADQFGSQGFQGRSGSHDVPFCDGDGHGAGPHHLIEIVQGEDGKLSNDVTRMRAHIALAPIQQTAAYKQQLAERLTNAMAQLPPQASAAVFDMLVELMDVPNKHEFAERVRNALGIAKPADDMSEEEQAAAQQQAQMQQAQAELAMREVQAKVAELEAKAAKWQADAERAAQLANSVQTDDKLTEAQTIKTLQEAERLAAERERLQAENAALRSQMLSVIQSQIDNIQL